MSPVVDAMVMDLAGKLVQLMASGENWQIALHGGRGGRRADGSEAHSQATADAAQPAAEPAVSLG